MDINYDYIVCPLCGKHVQRLKRHFFMAKIHKGFDYETYLKEHPEIPTLSGKEAKRYSETQLKYCSTSKGRNQMSRMANLLWQDEEKREKRIEGIRKQHESLEFKILHQKVGRKFMLEKMSTPEGFRYMTRGIKTYGKRTYYTTKEGKILPLRSHLEEGIAIKLDSFNDLLWEYESISIPWYDDNGQEHQYYPDFYLPQYSVVIEGKPKSLWSREDTIIRKEAAEKLYKFYLCDYDTSIIDEIIENVTTIESITNEKDISE